MAPVKAKANRAVRLAAVMAVVLALVLVLGLAVAGLPGAGGGVGAAAAAAVYPRKIVVFREDVSDAGKEDVVRKHGLGVVRHTHLVNASVVVLPADAAAAARVLRALRGEAKILRIDDDLVIRAVGKTTTAAAETLPWGVDRIDADLAWGSSTGAGVKVGILDTGIDLDHPDLVTNIRGGVNTIKAKRTADDDNGHGTHVAGTVAAVRGNGVGVIGAAPNVWLYAVKVLGRYGSGYLSDAIEGLEWSVNNGMRVVNMSWGASSTNQTFYTAIRKVYNAGIIQVAAAGNESGPVIFPAAYAEVIAVTACNSSNQFASWSNYGPEVDFIAPGVSILSTWRGGKYGTASGTSMATPHVTGTVALLLAANPGMTPAQVQAALASTAEYLPGLTSSQQGYGLVDAERAVAAVW